MYTQIVRTFQIKNQHTQSFAGYVAYWKLLGQFLKMTNEFHSSDAYKKLSIFKRITNRINLLFYIPFAIIFKPMKAIYSFKDVYEGIYDMINNQIIWERFNVKKTTTHYLFKIPLIKHKSKISAKDINYLLKQ